ncbi:MAG: NAD-dependent epimerase/dehydratase family protein [Opitutales bacterium]
MNRSMTIFGCGYLGSELARQALSRGFQVNALTHNPETAEALRVSGVHSVVEAELGDDSWHQCITSDQDFVVNCVGASGTGLAGYVKSYVDGQVSISGWAEKVGIGTFVFTSSVSVYPQTDRSLVDENSSCEGVSDRGALLLAAEGIGFPGPASVERSFVLRLAGIYGPGRHVFLDRLRAGEPEWPGNGEAFLNLIHRDDACSAIWATLESPLARPGRIYNLSDGQPVPRMEVVSWLAEQTGTKMPRFSSGSGPSPSLQSIALPPNRKIDNRRIREELDWDPVYPSFREGYLDLLEKE